MKVHEIDAKNQSLGRLASKVATLLRGKDSPSFEPNIDPHVQVVIKNIDKIKFTGTKMDTKVYHHYSGFPGGMKDRSLKMEWVKQPKEIVRKAIYRMLPVNRMRDKIIRNLKFQ
jgi:large subunit ribosomal protein L13